MEAEDIEGSSQKTRTTPNTDTIKVPSCSARNSRLLCLLLMVTLHHWLGIKKRLKTFALIRLADLIVKKNRVIILLFIKISLSQTQLPKQN